MRNEIEALLRAVESAGHIDVCASYEDLSCDCDLRDIRIAAAAVRAELAREPVELRDGELAQVYLDAKSEESVRDDVPGVLREPHAAGLRAVARAARGAK